MSCAPFFMPDPLSPAYLNVEGVRQLISSRMNKTNDPKNPPLEGASDEEVDELTLKMSDEELLALKNVWEIDNQPYNDLVKSKQDKNKLYYLGMQGSSLGQGTVIADNILFEAEETFLPAALSKNPEPVVFSDNEPDGVELSKQVKIMLQYLADKLTLRLKLKRGVRHWSIYYTGVFKHYWNKKTNEIDLKVVFPQNIIFDKDGYIEDNGDYDGKFLGERNTTTAEDLINMFPKNTKAKAYITLSVNNKLGTSVTYTEWSTPLYCFYTYKDLVLGKYRNSNWNYDTEQGTGEYEEDKEVIEIVPGRNHFAYPKIPYTFFSVFNLGEHPYDDTTLIEQNIPNQDLVVDRNYQITCNLQNANNGLAVSGDHFNKEDAKEANDAVRRGKGIFVPSGDVRTAVLRLPAPSLPNGLMEDLADKRQELRSIFGTQGISSQQPNENTTARGMILNQQFDTSRIGGGIGDVIAQVADNIFNWWVQMMYVYYDEEHIGAILGNAKAVEYVALQRSDFYKGDKHRQLVVSVAPDSMKPKDEITQMNLATDMWANGSLDPLSYYEMLNLPDPKKLLERLVLWKTNPQALLGGGQAPPIPGAPPGMEDQNVEGQQGVDTTGTENATSALSSVPINQGAAMPT